MRPEANGASVQRLADLCCSRLGLELVDIAVRPGRDAVHVQVLADRPAGGIGIEECAALNRALDKELEPLFGPGNYYTLEVASPGLDRPLRSVADFRRSVGQDVRLYFRSAGRSELCGRIIGVGVDDMILLGDDGETVILFSDIDKGLLIV